MTDGRMQGSRQAIRRNLIVGFAMVLLLIGGVGSWAASLQFSGAVVASGLLVVDSNVKKVQHPTGGIVAELPVRNGDRVKAGDLLVKLDDTVTRANHAIVVKSLNELAARQARLEAERDSAEKVTFPESLTSLAKNPEVATIIDSERKLFEFRNVSRTGQKSQLRERIKQLQEEIGGLTTQATAKAKEVELINRELEGVRDLWTKNLVTIQRLSALERDATRITGERGQLIAQTAQAKGKIAETELQIIQIDQDLRSEVTKDLREIQGKTAELVERKVAAEDSLNRIEIRSPQDGVVHQVAVHTIGGVIGPAEAVMMLVPERDSLTIEAKINPPDIDQIKSGQAAVLRFSSFNRDTTPELNGALGIISPDLLTDQRTGANYYLVRVILPDAEIRRLGNLKLVPGMPVEVFIQTSPRTVLSFLTKPIQDQISRAFRER